MSRDQEPQGEKPKHGGMITPSQIGGEAFWFEEKQFLIVEPDHSVSPSSVQEH